MARKSWSYVLFGAAVVNVVLAAYLAAPIRWVSVVIVSGCVVGGVLIRRTMIGKRTTIGKVERAWEWGEEGTHSGDVR